MVGDQGHADARCHLQALPVQRHWLGQQLTQGVGQFANPAFHHLAAALQAAEQYHELVAAQARHGVLQAHAGLEAGGDDL